MRSAAGLGFLLALGIWVGHALAALPGPNQLPTTTLPTLPLTTSVPKLTTSVPKLTTSIPKLTTSVPKLTTSVPKLTTSVPKLTTSVPKLTTSVPKLPTTTTVPKLPATTTTASPSKLPTTTTSQAATSGSSGSPITSILNSARSLGSSGPGGSRVAAGAGSSGSGSSSGSGASGGPSGDPASSQSGPQVQQLKSSRPFLATKGPKRKRRVIITFVLSAPARVVFAVRQVSPVCRTIGYFSVRGRKGINRIRFAGRVGRKRLGVGTYKIFARTQGGELVRRVTLVVVKDSTPSRKLLRTARAANVCSDTRDFFSAPDAGGVLSGFASRDRMERPVDERFANGPPNITREPDSGGVLGAAVEKTADAIRPFLVALLAAAILALALASLPAVAVPDNRLSELLARHRLEITTIGAAALVAVAIAFLIG